MKTNKYRFIFLIPILLACVVTTSHAQFKVGFKGGVNVNSLRPEDKVRLFVTRNRVENNLSNSQSSSSTSSPVNRQYHLSDISVIAFNAGGYATYQVLSFINARAELLYFQQGGTLENYYALYPSVQHQRVRLTQHMIQVPLMVEIGVPGMEEKSIQPKLRLGGYYGFNIASRERFDNISKNQYENTTVRSGADVSDAYVYNQAGILVGLGADFKMGDKDFSVELRYNQNLTIIQETDAALSHLNATMKNYGGDLRTSTLSLNFGMTLFNF